MELGSFTADEMFEWLVNRDYFLLLDVRNDVEFDRFKVEGPYPVDMLNVPYMEFIEMEDKRVAKVPRGKKVRIVCAKEGSSNICGRDSCQPRLSGRRPHESRNQSMGQSSGSSPGGTR